MKPELVEKLLEMVLSGLAADTQGGAANPPADFGTEHKIVVLQRGFVYAGDVTIDGEYLTIENAVNIRRWGTTRGLGELAARGNLPETKADPCGTVRVHVLSVINTIDCEGAINATA